MKIRHFAWLAALAVPAGALHYSGCTVFDDAVATGGGGQGGDAGTDASGGGGSGGAPPPTLLDPPDAAKICGMAQSCPLLAASLITSLGLPIGRATTTFVTVPSQSECLTWLAGPVPAARRSSRDHQHAILAPLVEATSCEEAASLLAVEFINGSTDDSCAGVKKSHCDGDDAHVCGRFGPNPPSIISHCASDLFDKGGCQLLGADKAPTCTHGPCGAGGGSNGGCQTGSKAKYCDKTTDTEQEFDCSYQGLGCSNGFCNNAGDSTPRPCSQDTPGVVECNGNTLSVCDGKLYVDFDCDGMIAGSECEMDDDPDIAFRCAFPHEECAPRGSPDIDVCDADKKTLQVCIAGKMTSVVCPKGTSCQDTHCFFD